MLRKRRRKISASKLKEMKKESHEENNNIISGSDVVARRKRGRPRKQPKLGSNEQPLAPPPGFSNRVQEQPLAPPPGFSNRIQQQPLAPPPAPGFSRRTQQQPYQREDGEDRVGQPISGVIEATFDAGYLLSVKVENSDIMLRGVVFKTGGCEPVSVDNDVAPNVPMIRRNTDLRHHHASAEGGREKHGSDVRTRALVPVLMQPALPTIPEHMVAPLPIQPALPTIPEHMVAPVPIQPARQTIPEHMVVPVVLQPVNLQNSGSRVLVQHGPKKKETGSQVTGASNGNPFETMVTQLMKNGQAHRTGESIEAESDEQALTIEPLQVLPPVLVPKPMPSDGKFKMTGLLQDNVRDTHFSQGE